MLISRAEDGSQLSRPVRSVAISADASTAAFATSAPELIADPDGQLHTYVVDLPDGYPSLVTRDWMGRPQAEHSGNACGGGCGEPALSADGRFVVFTTWSDNIVPGDANDVADVYRYDRANDRLDRVSIGMDGSDTDGRSFAKGSHVMSLDGQRIVFYSYASNLQPGEFPSCQDEWDEHPEPCGQVYMRDLATGQTKLVSQTADGRPANGNSGWTSISGDGTWVFFVSRATNLHPNDSDPLNDVYGRNVDTGELVLVTDFDDRRDTRGGSWWPTSSHNGSIVAFPSNRVELGAKDDFINLAVTELRSGQFHLVSHDLKGEWSLGHVGRVTLSGTGDLVVFDSRSSDLVEDEDQEELNGYDLFSTEIDLATAGEAFRQENSREAEAVPAGAVAVFVPLGVLLARRFLRS